MSKTLERCREIAAATGRVVKKIINAPDYDTYVAHLSMAHPGTTPMSYEEFSKQRLEESYSRPGSRCC